jgi:N-acetylneuraminic acid mutarotase
LLAQSVAMVAALGGGLQMWAAAPITFDWHDLPQLPESIAGQCVGTVGDLLVVAGGSSWTKAPWDGGTKLWSDKVFGLAPGAGQWQLMGHLPTPRAYGSAVQAGQAMLCIGGQDATQTYNTTLQLTLKSGKLDVKTLADLPQPITNAVAASAGDKVYVVGGQHTLNPKDVSSEIWSLNLADPSASRAWKREPSPPWKHARILPVVAGCGSAVYVASGADLAVGAEGAPLRTYLSDAWRLKRGLDWERLPDLPAPVAGAPSICDPSGSLVVFGGDDGNLATQIFTLKNSHPGFSLKVLRFDVHDSTWSAVAQLPLSLVTTNATFWSGQYVIAGGEDRPGHRANRVVGSGTTHR